MAEGGRGEGPNRNRPHPHNLQGVLRLAVEAGSASEEPPSSAPMSEERRAWLQEVLSETCKGGFDEVQQIKQCLAVLSREGAGEEEEGEEEEEEEVEGAKEEALDLLSDLCENLDNAQDLMKLGGLDLAMSRCLTDPSSGIRWRAAHLIGSACQNLPGVQCHLLTQGALPRLLSLVDKDPSDTVRVKALYAVSCLVRELEVGLTDFLSHDGFSVLMRGMQSGLEKLRTKAAFLLQNLLTSHPEHRETLIAMGMVQQLVSLLRLDHSPFHEHVLGALCSLVSEDPRGVAECRDPHLRLEGLLKDRARELRDRVECQVYCVCLSISSV
ncbi:HPBP1 protein, partial [Polyodon spathula]|nr:HPBP1 protein [Polyodon spathula]